MSRFSLVEAAAEGALNATSAYAEVRVVSAGNLGAYAPQVRPAAVLALLSPIDKGAQQANQHTRCEYDVPVAVVFYGSADADDNARYDTWALADTGMDAMTNLPVSIPDTSLGAFRPGRIENCITEAGQTGIYVEFLITLTWQR